MAKPISFPIEPTILKYARKNSGYSIEAVCKSTKISQKNLEQYESEKCGISLPQLYKLANIYKRPIAYFLLPKIPADVVLPKDFRNVFDSSLNKEFSPKFFFAVRRARYIQSVLEELWQGEIKYNFPKADLDSDIEKLGSWFREVISFSFEEQLSAKNPALALKGWKTALEKMNIFILQSNLSADQISAFCLADQKPYVVMLNSEDHPYRRIFSLLHEVGHLILNKSGVCNPEELENNSKEYIKIEKFCNQFAASILLPSKLFLADSKVQSLLRSKYDSWSESLLLDISRRFKVSEEMLLRRFMSLGYLDEKYYKEWRNTYLENTKDFVKPKMKNVKIPRYVICLSQNGRALTSFVMEKFYSNAITFNTVSEILNISPKYIGSLEKYL